MNATFTIRKLLLGSALLVAAVTAAQAATKTWNGGTSADWNTAGNWSASGVPVAADDVVFDGTGANLNLSLSAAGPLKSLTFTAGQTAGVNINTTAGSNNIVPSNASGSLTVAAGSGNHKITGTGISSSGSSRDFAILGSLTGFTFDIGSGTSFEINGRVGGGTTGAIYAKNGAGTLILSGQNGGGSAWQFSAASGMFNVNLGVVRLANTNAFGNSGNRYTVFSGAAIELSGGFTQTVNGGTITLNGSGIATGGALRSTSGVNIISGTQASGVGGIILGSDSSIGVDAGSLTISQVISGSGFNLTKVGAGTLTLSGTNTYNGGTIVNGGTLSLGASNVLVNTTPVSIGAAILSVGATFTDTVGTLDVTGAATINLGDATSALTFANSSAVDWTGGTLNITGALGATSLRFGTTSGGLTSGQLALISVNGSGAGTYTLDASGYLSSSKTWDGSDTNSWGTGANWSGDALPGDVELAVFTSASPSGYDIYMGTAARTIRGILFDSTTGSNPYTINLKQSSTVTTSRTLTVGTGGIIVDAGAHTIKGDKLGTNNNGPLILTGAPFHIAANSSLTFDVRLKQSAVGQSYSKTGAGTLVLNADNGGGSGWISAGFTVSQGVLRFAAANATGNSANTFSVSSGAALELTGGVSQGIGATGTGTITLNGTGISSNGALRSLSGNNSLTSSGGTGGIILNADSSIGVDADSLTISQVISGAGFNLTKVGAGMLTLSNSNTYGGTTTVSVGTLALNHATNTLPDATAVSLGAATLSVATGSADTVGTLDLTGAATINLGDATSALIFANSSAKTWTGGTLNITGTFVPGASIKFGVGGLIGGQLAKISATGWTSFALDGSGFLTATAVGGSTYSNWASLNGAGPNLADDHDNDGVDNGTEYFLGGPAGLTTGFTHPLPGVTNSGGSLSVKWTKGPGYTGTYGTHFQVETSATLADPWVQETIAGGNITLSGNDVIYTFPGGPAYSGKKFARLKVTGP